MDLACPRTRASFVGAVQGRHEVSRAGGIIEYVRTGRGLETDFVVRDPLSGAIQQLIQVCWSLESESTRKRELRGLRAAMEETGCSQGTIVTWQDESKRVEDPDIEVVPGWRFMLPDF